MTTAAPMTLPGSRALAGWWRECAALSPRRLWFGHLVLHRVEALVEVDRPPALTGLARALLAYLRQHAVRVRPEAIAAELALEPTLVAALLGRLREGGLIESERAEGVGLTAAGREAQLSPSEGRRERRSFYFTDTRPPHYLPLSPQAAVPLPAPAGWRFDLGVLEACLARPVEWKGEHGFPADVVRVIGVKGGAEVEPWRAVPLDRPEQAYLLLVEQAGGAVQGFSVQPAGWALSREPALTLPVGSEVLAGLGADVGAAAWRQAWQSWCQQRSLPAGEVDACRLEPVGRRLLVKAPGRLVERLRQLKSEALRGETWLLAGSGRIREAGLVELVP